MTLLKYFILLHFQVNVVESVTCTFVLGVLDCGGVDPGKTIITKLRCLTVNLSYTGQSLFVVNFTKRVLFYWVPYCDLLCTSKKVQNSIKIQKNIELKYGSLVNWSASFLSNNTRATFFFGRIAMYPKFC